MSPVADRGWRRVRGRDANILSSCFLAAPSSGQARSICSGVAPLDSSRSNAAGRAPPIPARANWLRGNRGDAIDRLKVVAAETARAGRSVRADELLARYLYRQKRYAEALYHIDRVRAAGGTQGRPLRERRLTVHQQKNQRHYAEIFILSVAARLQLGRMEEARRERIAFEAAFVRPYDRDYVNLIDALRKEAAAGRIPPILTPDSDFVNDLRKYYRKGRIASNPLNIR